MRRHEEGPPGFTFDIITGSLCIDVRQDKEESTDWFTEAQGEEPQVSSDDEDEPSTTQELNQREQNEEYAPFGEAWNAICNSNEDKEESTDW